MNQRAVTQSDAIDALGERLRAARMGAGLTPDQLADLTGVSRAAIYRYEAGHPVRVDTLGRIADHLGVSIATLLGVAVEYVSTALAFFERMRQIEEKAERISVMFGPVSYLLTTDRYDALLPEVLRESVPEDVPDRAEALAQIDQVLEVLKRRKAAYRARPPHVVSLVSAVEIEAFCDSGFVGTQALAGRADRRAAARAEVENIIEMLNSEPIGVQIGVLVDSMPGASFQIFRGAARPELAMSPFRLGALANVRLGVATITSAPEAVAQHEAITEQLWRRSLKGRDAAAWLEKML
ncbi:helix-turn-helix transcriptional regulator [Roseivivax sp. GX 12232]|uniref:helix-turn-helix domain-containing protein n=1 Tax=Roseivivax sp. GX 12232 TaxID=2900547 RepID=UPI001E613B5A|nr:helix-turn-helix transcriptional regulator [Roseivivax sp. GX 12232]